jgi:hypothetical protein
MANKLRSDTGQFARGNAGRPKGSANKLTASVREAIETAFQSAGGADYLVRQAEENPVAFMMLLGKILPRDLNVTGNVDVDAIAERLDRARQRVGMDFSPESAMD